MNQEERQRELFTAMTDKDALERLAQSLATTRDRYRDTLSHVLQCMERYLGDAALGSSTHAAPDLRNWPTASELERLFADTFDTHLRLSRATQRLREAEAPQLPLGGGPR